MKKFLIFILQFWIDGSNVRYMMYNEYITAYNEKVIINQVIHGQKKLILEKYTSSSDRKQKDDLNH